jgi:hypothetical protein
MPPSINSQPSNTTACVGSTASFCVTATGTGLFYQWQLSASGCSGPWTNIVSATSACLTINPTSPLMNGYGYRCVVSGDCAPSAASNCGILTVNTPVAITAQPANSTVCAGLSTSFTVAASGTTPTYQWQESTNGGASWSNISNGGVYSGVTTTTLTLTGVTAGMSAYQYRVIVSGAASCSNVVNSNAIILTVQTAPVITASPSNSTVYTGNPTNFSVSATGTAVTYQWQFSTGGCNGTWANVPNTVPYSGGTTAILNINPTSTAMSGYAYRCVTGGTCVPAATSGCAILTVNTPVTIISQPAASVICSASNTSFTVSANGTTPTYQWQESTNGGATWNNITNTGIYSGAATSTLTLTGVTAAMTANQYRCVVTGAAPGGFVNSNPAVLNVTPQPVISATITALLAGQQSVLSVNVAPVPGLTFAWYLNGVLISGASSNSITATVNSLGSYRVVVSSGSGNCQSLIKDITALPSSDLFVFPSPNDGVFSVSYYTAGVSSANPSKQSITIYDALGRRVHNKEYTVSQAYQLHRIDMRHNGGGVYFIVLREANGNKIKTGKVVVQ